MVRTLSVIAFLLLVLGCRLTRAQDTGMVTYRDQFVHGMYVQGDVSEFARAAGMDPWTYIGRMMDDLRDMGLTVIHPNNLDFADLQRWCEMAQARGLRVIAQGTSGFYNYYAWDPTDPFGSPDPAVRRQIFQSRVLPFFQSFAPTMRANRTLLAYCLTEEVNLTGDLMVWEDLRDLTSAIRTIDPSHPGFVEHLDIPMAVLSLQIQRPEMLSFGPGTLWTGPWSQDLDDFEQWLEPVGRACRQFDCAFYAVLDSMTQYRLAGGQWVPRVWTPTAADYGLQAWLAWAEGAQGFDFWWYHTTPDQAPDGTPLLFRGVRDENDRPTPVRDAIASLSRQLGPLSTYVTRLRIVEDNGGLSYARSGSWVRLRLMRMPDTGETFLLAVNKDTSNPQPIGADLSSLLPCGAQATLVPDGTAVDPMALQVPPGQGVLLRLGCR